MEEQSAYYAVDVEEAAARLQESPHRVREMLATGELEGIPPGATAQGDWKVLLPATPDLEEPTRVDEPPESPSEKQEAAPPSDAPADEGPEGPAETAAEEPAAEESPEEFVGPPETAAEAEGQPAASEELARGDAADTDREPTAPSGWVSTQQAARALGISPRTVRWHIEQGNLEAKPQGEGVRRSWLVSIDSLQAFRDARQAAGEVPRDRRAPSEGAETAAEGAGNAIRELADRLAEEAARAAEYRVRLEITAKAESTLRAELEEERRRREEAERERDELRRRLDTRSEEPRDSAPAPASAPTPAPAPAPAAERVEEPPAAPVFSQGSSERRPWWRRMFGG